MQDQKVPVTESGNQASFRGIKIVWIPLAGYRKWALL